MDKNLQKISLNLKNPMVLAFLGLIFSLFSL